MKNAYKSEDIVEYFSIACETFNLNALKRFLVQTLFKKKIPIRSCFFFHTIKISELKRKLSYSIEKYFGFFFLIGCPVFKFKLV